MNPAHYPLAPGVRANSTGETAQAAAIAIAPLALTLQQRCLVLLSSGPASPEELKARIEAELGRVVLLTSVRPRLSALKALGLVTDSGERALGEGGRCKAIRWRLTTPEERVAEARRRAAS